MVKIYVDADACPVKNEIERIAVRHDLITYMVCNGGIRPCRNPLIKLVVVNQGNDKLGWHKFLDFFSNYEG